MELNTIRKSTDLPKVNFVGVPPDNVANNQAVLPHGSSNVLEVLAISRLCNVFPQEYEIISPSGVPLRVYRQPSSSKSSILTYHDIGTNRKSCLISLVLLTKLLL